MFRELARKNKRLPQEDCIALLQNERRGILSVHGDDGYPYGSPMNHYYHDDGCIYFHCGRAGHRLDALRRDDKVSYCVMDKGVRPEGEWAYNVRSVIVFGRVEIIADWIPWSTSRPACAAWSPATRSTSARKSPSSARGRCF